MVEMDSEIPIATDIVRIYQAYHSNFIDINGQHLQRNMHCI